MEASTTADRGRPGNIVLTGFMGTGKTTVGRRLAERLGRDFVDTDQLIERRHGAITDIFAERGEPEFRRLEREIVGELAARTDLVIATGGRLMVDETNAALLGATGRVVCLHADLDTILERIGGEAGERPLLAVDDPRARIGELLAERREAYARFVPVDTAGRSPDEIVDEIVRLIDGIPTRDR